jgi:hypothetical protein
MIADPTAPDAAWLFEQEARALLTRLDGVRPFVLQETLVPAAAISPAALSAIECYLMKGRRVVGEQVREFLGWLRGTGHVAQPEEQQRRFTAVRLGFNTALSQMDLFSEVITQRSEHEIGVWLSGLDVAAAEALLLPGRYYEAPPVICHLHRGLGGAIRRARTRLPGGGDNPVSIIRIPRERMIGYGIASSLVHETGHQGAALLGLVESLRSELRRRQRRADHRDAWVLWEGWVSEVVADFWSIAKVGIASTLGLVGLVSLPRSMVFRMLADDPHPFPWIRVQLSCAIGERLYPAGPRGQWRRLASLWRGLYPARGLAPGLRDTLADLERTTSEFASLLADHRPAALRGRTLAEVLAAPDRAPPQLIRRYRGWGTDPARMHGSPPTLAFAVLGQARASGLITPEKENTLLRGLITEWALKSTLETARACAGLGRVPMHMGQPAIWRLDEAPASVRVPQETITSQPSLNGRKP